MDLKSLSGKTKTITTCIIFSLCLFWSHIYRNKTLFTGVLDKLFEYWWTYLFLYIFWIKLGFPPLYTFNIYNCNWSFFRFWSSVNALTSKHWWQLRRTTKKEIGKEMSDVSSIVTYSFAIQCWRNNFSCPARFHRPFPMPSFGFLHSDEEFTGSESQTQKSGTLIFVDIRLSTLSPFLVEDKEKNVPWSA